jgi:hypothetical protein
VYASEVKPRLSPEDEGKIVAVDVDTGLYEIGSDELEVCDRLRNRYLNITWASPLPRNISNQPPKAVKNGFDISSQRVIT